MKCVYGAADENGIVMQSVDGIKGISIRGQWKADLERRAS